MTAAAHSRVRLRLPMPGLVIVPQSVPFRIAIEDLAMVALCSDEGEWVDRVEFLPLART